MRPRRSFHNVVDRRNGSVGSWEVEPLAYDALGPEHVGRTVIYCDRAGRADAGTIASWRDGMVFVRYTSGDTAAATAPEHLWLATEEGLR